MKNKYFAILAATFATATLANGATFLEDFSSLTPGTPGTPLLGYNGWTQSEANPGGGPLAFGVTAGSSNAAAIGVPEDVPVGSSFTVAHSLSVPLTGATLMTTFTIIDSDLAFPDRNDYSISIYSGATTLFSLNLVAANQSPPDSSRSQWNAIVPGAVTPLFAIAQEQGLYMLTVNFAQNGLDVDYAVSLANGDNSSIFTTNGKIDFGDGLNIDSYVAGTSIGSGADWGNGFIAIDNVAVVPEVSSFVLLGMAALGLASRRRRD